MKKVILTVSALVVAAAMVFTFAGCTDNNNTNEEDSTVDAAVVTEVDTAA